MDDKQDNVIIEVHIAIWVKEVVANIIKQGIIAIAKHSFKQAIKTKQYWGEK